MKKILLAIFSLCLLVGCTNMSNTPSKKVEEYLGKYQTMDNDVLTQLEDIITQDLTMSDEQKKEYRALMEKQYQNLSYKIKNETIDGDSATVDVEIEVFDYQTSLNKSEEYYNDHMDEFMDDNDDNNNNNNNDNDTTDNGTTTDDNTTTENDTDNDNLTDATEGNTYSDKFIEYKIKQLKDVTDKANYTITFALNKENGNWVINDLSDADIMKIHGLYNQ